VRVEGQLVFDDSAMRLSATLAGLGLAYLPEDQVQTHLADGRLIRVLDDWCPRFSGYHLYYPSLAGRCAALPGLRQRHP